MQQDLPQQHSNPSQSKQFPADTSDLWQSISNASSIVIDEKSQHEELEERVLEWFQKKGVKLCSPQEIFEQEEDRYKRSISMKSCAHINEKPTLSSKRDKLLASLHISLDFEHAAPPRLGDSY